MKIFEFWHVLFASLPPYLLQREILSVYKYTQKVCLGTSKTIA